MQKVVKFLTENPIVYLATVADDGRPRVRPFQFMLEQGGKLYFCTCTEKPVYRQIQHMPYIELSVATPKAEWLRIAGKVVFSDDREIKAKILKDNPLVESLYHAPDNPIFTLFHLEEAHATICDFSDNPPQEYDL